MSNRILLGLNTAVVRTGSIWWSSRPASAISRRRRCGQIQCNEELLPKSLAAAGVSVEEVDIVINTHLHFDHCGWNTTLQADGSVTPTFPNARYFAHRGEVEHGHLQLDRDRVSYLSPNYDPLVESGQMTLLDLDHESVQAGSEICPGISVELSRSYAPVDGGSH